MNKNSMSYKTSQFLMFAGVSTVLFCGVVIIPFIYGLYLTFTSWDGVSRSKPFVGFANYAAAFADHDYWVALGRTLIYSAIAVILINIVAFLLAYMVTSGVKGQNFFRAGFFIPNLIGGIVLGSIWQFIFSSILPSIGQALNIAGLSKSLITNTNTVMFTMVTVNTWQYAGYIMLIFVAAIQGIPKSVMEAAEVDGAPYWRRIRSIQIPLMANSFTISLFLTLTNSFKMYDVNVALTNGGPTGLWNKTIVNSSELLALNIYNTAFKYNKMAQGQAKAVIFFLVLVVFSVIQVSWNKSKEVEM